MGGQGYQSDSDSGLMLLGARYYDPSVGRFISRDPLRYGGGDVNLYGYCGNDPVNKADPSGMIPPIAWVFVLLLAGVYAGSGQETTGAEIAAGDIADAYVVATGKDFSGTTVGLADYLITVIGLAIPVVSGGMLRGGAGGTLTAAEREGLQEIADTWQTDLYVVGSRGAGNGRSIDTDLPFGKGDGTRSDIDIRYDPDVEIGSYGGLTSDIYEHFPKPWADARPLVGPPYDPYITISPRPRE